MSSKRSYEGLTPTEALIMEVLAGRWRTGEKTWTFSTIHTKAFKGLKSKGMVCWKHGSTEKSILAWLTDEGRQTCLDPTYVAPNER